MSFVIGPYQAIERPGVGRRTAPTWRGRDVRGVDDVAMTVLAVDTLEAVRGSVNAARALCHPHLLPITDVVQDDVRLAIVCPWPRGGRLAELILRRGPLPIGEALTVLIPIASALAAVHESGGGHGGVCPEVIWFDAAGRPLLGAVAVSRILADLSDGLPLVVRDIAPEMVRAGPGAGPTPSADIFSLGSVALYCLTGRSAWPADEAADVLVQSAAGQWPDLPEDIGPSELVDLVRSMLRRDPARRPSAGEVVRRLERAGTPEAVRFGNGPTPTVASSSRWRGWTRSTDRPHEHDDATSREQPSVTEPPESPTAAQSPEDPVEAARRGPLARLGIALCAGLLLTLIVVTAGQWWTESRTPTADAAAGDSSGVNWAQVLTDLDRARGRALAAADSGMLSDVYIDDAASARADAGTIAMLAEHGWRVVDGVHELVSVTPEGSDGGQVRLAVIDTLPAHSVVDADGREVGLTPSRTEQRRVIVLTATDSGYRISDIEPG